MEDKKSLASPEERARIKGKASLLAALDYYVSMHSDIFISASPGNMHNALVSFFYCFLVYKCITKQKVQFLRIYALHFALQNHFITAEDYDKVVSD